MEAVRLVRGRAVPLDRRDVDTDQIIPAAWLKRIERTGYGAGLFSAWREDPGFVLDQPERAGSTVLVAGANFGCGSSREHAPWALHDWGFRAVVAPSFADIFRGNCLKTGLLPVQLPQEAVSRLLAATTDDPSVVFEVDVEAREVRVPSTGERWAFPLEESARWRLLNGLDDIGITLTHEDEISGYEATRPSWLPAVVAV